ncbi:MAG: hypothetical protein ABI718_10515 [Acidobacteriota bacterium]
MAAAVGWAGVSHYVRLFVEQRIYFAAFLISIGLTGVLSAQDFSFDPAITQSEFRKFSLIIGQGIYPTPVQPGGNRGILAFDVGVAAIALPVDEEASYWTRAVDGNLTTGGYLLAPRVVVTKGLGFASVSGSYAQLNHSKVKMFGGTVEVPILGGSAVTPSLVVRGGYGQISGVDELDLKTYGAEVFLSKGFGPFTPYAAAGAARTESRAVIPATTRTPEIVLEDRSQKPRFTIGFQLSFVVPRFVVEATQGEQRSYAAKVSFGL